jgi:hypothetical protein
VTVKTNNTTMIKKCLGVDMPFILAGKLEKFRHPCSS